MVATNFKSAKEKNYSKQFKEVKHLSSPNPQMQMKFAVSRQAYWCPCHMRTLNVSQNLTNPFQDYFPSLNDFIHSQNMATSVWKRFPLVKTSTHDLCTFQTTQATPSTLSLNLLPWSSSPPPWRTRTSGSSLMGSTSRRRPPSSRMKSRWKVVGDHKSSDFRFSKLVVALCLDGEINPLGNIWVLKIASIPHMLLRIYGGQKSVPCDLCFFSDVPSSHMMGKAQLFLNLWQMTLRQHVRRFLSTSISHNMSNCTCMTIDHWHKKPKPPI